MKEYKLPILGEGDIQPEESGRFHIIGIVLCPVIM